MVFVFVLFVVLLTVLGLIFLTAFLALAQVTTTTFLMTHFSNNSLRFFEKIFFVILSNNKKLVIQHKSEGKKKVTLTN
jgi:hypothetical protein